MASSFLVRLTSVSLAFSKERVLQDISLELRPGQLVTLVGPNGAGKSTLLKVILGLVQPTQGTIEKRPSLRVGYMPQKFAVNPLMPLTVERFLTLPPDGQLSVHASLKAVSGLHLLKKSFHHLSGGEVQRVLLAQAFLRAPHLLVLDEPSQGLDIDGQRLFYTFLQTFREKSPSTTILLASHDLYMVLKTSDHVICLNRHICCVGHPDNVRQHPSYLKLFGEEAPPTLAPYTHHHAHRHGESEREESF